MRPITVVARVLVVALLLAGLPARATFHLFSMSEIYSNADGTVQYLELTALAGGQQFLAGHVLTARSGASSRTFTFPANLPGDTAGRKFLVATQGFADLGIVTSDYILPNGFFFMPGGTVDFAGADLWTYDALPADGVLARNRDGSSAQNSPTNFAGNTGTIPAPGRTLMVTRAGSGAGKVTSAPAGIDCGTTCSATFAASTRVTLTHTPTAGSAFTGWSGDCAEAAACTVTLDAARSVTATFQTITGAARFANLATRGVVQSGDGVMIAGLIIHGDAPQTVLVTARGPSLAAQGVPGAISNPSLALYSGQTVIASNDDWGASADAAAISATGLAPPDSRESALLVTLTPGAYTAIVSGVGGATGIGIVEVFAR